MRTLFCFLLYSILALAQDALPLKLDQPAGREIAPGAAQSYSIELKAGDYAAGEIDQHSTKVDIAIFNPDGSQLRRFPGPAEDKGRFVFIAESPGVYRLELKTAEKAGAGKYELRMTELLSLDDRLRPAPIEDKYKSPRMEDLRKQIAADPTSTEAFWKQIAQEGTPIVERMDKDSQHVLVTFLWRGTPETRNVLVAFMPFAAVRPQDYLMSRMSQTDVWYKTLRLPAAARFTYKLSPNDPLVYSGPRARQRQATAQADPLNPKRWFDDPKSSKFDYVSRVELPAAPPQPWIERNPEVPAGKIETHKFQSELLKNERGLSVYTPPAYSADHRPYGLLVLFDESAYLERVPTPIILDNLIAARRIPPMVAVLIGNPSQATRNKELPPNPDFADFLAKELTPWMHAHYNVTSDPHETVVAGSSFGGIAAVYAGLRHAEVFGNVLCQSGSFWWAPDYNPGGEDATETETGWLAKQFIASPKLPLRFYMDAGLFEVDVLGGGGAILEPSRHMRDVLLAKGYDVRYQQMASAHDYLSWRGTLADGLMFLVGSAAR